MDVQNKKPETAADVLAHTDALLAGTDPTRVDLGARQAKNERLIVQLRKALAVQETELRRIVGELSAEARRAVHAEYAPLVQNVMDTVAALVVANREVRDFQQAFTTAGYEGLVTYWFIPPGWDLFDPADSADTFTAAWWRAAQKYVQHDLMPHEELPMPKAKPTALQRAAAVAKALGHRASNPDVGELIR